MPFILPIRTRRCTVSAVSLSTLSSSPAPLDTAFYLNHLSSFRGTLYSSSAVVFGGLGITASLATRGTVCAVCSNILARTFVIHLFLDVHTLFTLAIVEVKSGS